MERQPVLYLVASGASPARELPGVVADLSGQWDICVITTPEGSRFFDVDQMAELTGHPVRTSFKDPDALDVLPPADAFAAVPATFNTINKWAAGISDTLALGLLNEAVGIGRPIVTVPWPNAPLARHPAFGRSIVTLRECGISVIYDPGSIPDDGQPGQATFPWEEFRAEVTRIRAELQGELPVPRGFRQDGEVSESRFGMTELEDLPEDLRERVGEIASKSGFVPNIFRALGHRPAELRAFLDYHDALMDKSEGLSKAERELVVVATSAANFCTYCIVAHGAILRIRARNPILADQVAANPWQVELDERGRAIVDLALALVRTPEYFGDADIAAARDAGLTDDETWDVGAITALFAASNRLAHLAALQPNAEFYSMGR